MRKLLSLLLCAAFVIALFTGCSPADPVQTPSDNTSTPPTSSNPTDTGPPVVPPGSDPIVYRELYAGEIETLNYLITGNANEHFMAANMVDGLVQYDIYGIMHPALATSWEHNSDFTVWTFHIREGVKWVDADGKEVAEVTAQDWVDAARYVNTAENDSALQYMYSEVGIVNADEYYDRTYYEWEGADLVADGEYTTIEDYYADNGIDPSEFVSWDDVGVKATDKYTLVYTMGGPCPFFPTVLTYVSYLPVYGPFLDQMGIDFGTSNYAVLYNGAYILSTFEPQQTRIFTKNPTYWEADKVYIDTVELIYNSEAANLGPTMFQRGEVEYADIGSEIEDEWLGDPQRAKLIRPNTVDVDYSYFLSFNFEPRFEDEFEPNNWLKAVNNENFRQAIRYGVDRVKALTVGEPNNPQMLLNNTITPANFAIGGGKDYTQYAALKPFSDGDSFNEARAIQYRDAAKGELQAAGATFPIKIKMPYNPNLPDWGLECQVIEQQLEALLGSDFIDIIVTEGPTQGFLSAVRRSGDYALLKCNWGADYADPQTFASPFARGNNYNFMDTSDNALGGAPKTSKTAETQAMVSAYYDLVDAAMAIYADMGARYEAFAKAEAYIIDHAVVVPFHVDGGGYVASYLNPFERMYAPYGVSVYGFKGHHLLAEPMDTEQFENARLQWEAERAVALAQAG